MLITLARKPLTGSVANNVLTHGCGALNINACRVEGGERPAIEKTGERWGASNMDSCGFRAAGLTAQGRWPANVILSKSAVILIERMSGLQTSGVAVNRNRHGNKPSSMGFSCYGAGGADFGYGDSGSAARFFKKVGES